jgi:microcompartment protein CcmL/EutN
LFNEALGMLETTGLTPALVALDVMDKAARIHVLQAEINDLLGICIKVVGSTDDVATAVQAGGVVAERMGGKPVSQVIPRPDREAWKAINSPAEFNPLIQQDVVTLPSYTPVPSKRQSEENVVTEPRPLALGFIETQGFTAVFDAIDSACKAARVEVIGKEKLGGGYVTVVIQGDVAAVKAAIESGKSRVGELGKLIAAHVIARPSSSVMSLLPRA